LVYIQALNSGKDAALQGQ